MGDICTELQLPRGDCCKDGFAIRAGGEQTLRPLRTIVFFIFLGCFMGVAMIADVFMGAIEKVTSKRSRKRIPKTGRYVTVNVWNPTVANLTLMALGSSAPEILLNVIGVIKDNFTVAPLGPATIVGSAAFNLLCITAVCIAVIPPGEKRKIKDLPVYACTAAFSVFAYLWILLILTVFSPSKVQVIEGVLTFLFFPLLVAVSFALDKGMLGNKNQSVGKVISADIDKEELAELEAAVRQEHGANLTEEQVSKFVQVITYRPPSRAQRRVQATRQLTGGKKVWTLSSRSFTSKSTSSAQVVPEEEDELEKDDNNPKNTMSKIEFAILKVAVLEDAGQVALKVVRSGRTDNMVSVQYMTKDGSEVGNAAVAGGDYVKKEGTLVFKPGETEQTITVEIINDNAYEEDEEFYVDLFDPSPESEAHLGANSRATVVIIDDDLPGDLSFPEEEMHITQEVEDKAVDVYVHRKNGSADHVTCEYRTEDDSAIEGLDYEKAKGTLEFADGQVVAKFPLTIKGKGRYDTTARFRVILDGETGGVKFDASTDGGSESCILTVYIESDSTANARIDKLMSTLMVNWDKAKVGNENWQEQFEAAIYVNGGKDRKTPASALDWVMHIIALPWKLLFALCPPTDYCGGWLCFVCSLVFIGLVTIIIGDAAELLGCLLGIEDLITAITFVALGTSLPDTFASKTAALQDQDADASIVNVTGSNSVNVFLGIGLPWMISSIYWAAKGEVMVVDSPGLDFSVTIFTIFALICLTVLALRRKLLGCELGGPAVPKYCTSALFVTLWLSYIALSAWKVSDSS